MLHPEKVDTTGGRAGSGLKLDAQGLVLGLDSEYAAPVLRSNSNRSSPSSSFREEATTSILSHAHSEEVGRRYRSVWVRETHTHTHAHIRIHTHTHAHACTRTHTRTRTGTHAYR